MGWLSSVGDFVGGVGTGVWEGGKSMVGGVVDLAKGGYALATSSEARAQAWDTTKNVAGAVRDYGGSAIEDPAMVWRDAKNAAGRAYTAAEEFASTASAEDWGKAIGRGGFEVGTALIPVTKIGKLGTAARAADKLDDAADAGRLARVADDIADAARRFPDDAPIPLKNCSAASRARLGVAANGEALVDGVPVSKLSNNMKGNFGEAMADSYADAQGWTKLNGPPTEIGDKIDKGIDAVYLKDPGPPPKFVVADAKYGSAGLSKLKDGTRQMSDDWIRPRLAEAVDPKTRRQLERHGYERMILRVDNKGNVTPKNLD